MSDDAITGSAQALLELFGSDAPCFYRAAASQVGKKGEKVEATYFPIDGQPDLGHYASHIKGERALSIVLNYKGPEGVCNHVRRACVDIDDYSTGPEGIAAKLAEAKIPAVLTRSKSAGVHVNLFFRERIPARTARRLVEQVGAALGVEKADYFPKQETVDYDPVLEPNGNKGNGLNLCYFGDSRIGWKDGTDLSLPDFIAHCESMAIEADEVAALMDRLPVPARRDRALVTVAQSVEDAKLNTEDSLFFDGPPCLQKIEATAKAGSKLDNNRNNLLYNAAVYYKFKGAGDAAALQNVLTGVNNRLIDKPLTDKELGTIATSVFKTKNANYKCKEDPIAGLCNNRVCKTRRCGVVLQGVEPWFTLTIEKIRVPDANVPESDDETKYILRIKEPDAYNGFTLMQKVGKPPSFAEMKNWGGARGIELLQNMESKDWYPMWDAAVAIAERINVHPNQTKQGLFLQRLWRLYESEKGSIVDSAAKAWASGRSRTILFKMSRGQYRGFIGVGETALYRHMHLSFSLEEWDFKKQVQQAVSEKTIERHTTVITAGTERSPTRWPIVLWNRDKLEEWVSANTTEIDTSVESDSNIVAINPAYALTYESDHQDD